MSDSTPASATAEAGVGPALEGGAGPEPGVLRRLLRRPSGVVGCGLVALLVVVGVAAPWLAPRDPFAIDGPSLSPPSGRYPMGTDAFGRDLFSGIVFGARTSLLLTVLTSALVLVIGVAVGTLAGYRGGRVDDACMRVAEFFLVLPRFFLAIVVVALYGPGVERIGLVFGFTAWALLARVVRAEVLSLREREFVEAARAGGSGGWRIVVREILPNALPAALVYLGLLLGQVLLLEASLGFLGLSDPTAMSWGFLAGQAQPFLRVAWWMAVFPGAAILATVLGLNLTADALTEALGRRS